MSSDTLYVLTGTCASRLGSVELVTGFLFREQCYITELNTYDDAEGGQFFIRAEFRPAEDREEFIAQLSEDFAGLAESYSMEWRIRNVREKVRTLIMVSRFDHCLQDLLHRAQTGHLPIDVTAIVSNHPDFKNLADWYGIPYYHLPVTPDTKAAQEAELMKIVAQTDTALVVLARYMQVLSEDLCEKLSGRAINIHHSLLPGFKGAKPYHQAFDKGVKLVGATAHYVSNDLDEGPIITQGVEAVDHSYTPERLTAKGRDTERLTLARAVRLHCEDRIFLHGSKTVVFQGHE